MHAFFPAASNMAGFFFSLPFFFFYFFYLLCAGLDVTQARITIFDGANNEILKILKLYLRF